MTINETKYSPIGLVQVEEVETGKIVYETHNMIVESGRNRIVHSLFPADNNATDYTAGNLYKFYERNHRNLTVPNMTIETTVTDASTQCAKSDIIYDDGEDNNLSEIVLSTKTYDISGHTDGRKLYIRTTDGDTVTDEEWSGVSYNPNNGDEQLQDNQSLVIKFVDTYSSTNRIIHICCNDVHASAGRAITAVGLLYFIGGQTMTLFSRAAIDPIFMRPGRHYIMHYTLHF